MMRTKIFLNHHESSSGISLWVAHILVGVIVATIAFCMTVVEDTAAEFKADMVQEIIDKRNSAIEAWATYSMFCVICVVIASLLTIYVGPGAKGSGIEEIMGLLNGINFPNAIGIKTLFVKCFGTIFAVSGGLSIGKEGPLAHIGANIGAFVC